MVKEDALLTTTAGDQSTAVDALTEALKDAIGVRRYDAWFHGGISFSLRCDKKLTVTASSSLERECLEKHFKRELREAAVKAGLGKRRIIIEVDASRTQQGGSQPQAAEESAPTEAPSRPQPAPNREGLATVIAGECNQEALQLARMIASGTAGASPAVVWGPSGSGKSHLLKALRDEVRRRRRSVKVVYLTAEDFTSGFVDAVHARTIASFRGRHRSVDLLLIDDAQFLLGKPKTLEELQYTLDALASQGATVVLSSDRSPAELRKASGELLSRLAAGVSVEIKSPDYTTRAKLVEKFAGELGLPLEPDAPRLIAGSLLGGAWEARGVVNKLHLTWSLLGEAVEAGLIQRTIEDINRVSTPSVNIKDIQKAVCDVFGVEASILKSAARSKHATEPRMLAMWLSRKYTQAAWSEIGDQFGKRNHSTVISACRRVDQLMDRSASVRISGGPCQLQEALRLVEVKLRTA